MVIWMDQYRRARHATSAATRLARGPRGVAGSVPAQTAPSAALRAAACLIDPTFVPSCDPARLPQLYARASLV